MLTGLLTMLPFCTQATLHSDIICNTAISVKKIQNFRKCIAQMTIVIIKNFSGVLSFSISNLIESIGSCLELKCITNKDISTTLKYKTCRDNHSIHHIYMPIDMSSLR